MNFFEIGQFLVFCLYLAGTTLVFVGTLARREALLKTALGLTLGGFALHSVDLAAILFSAGREALLSGNFHLSLLAWFILLITFGIWFWLRNSFVGMLMSPLALILFTSSFMTGEMKVLMPKHFSGLFFGLHIGSIFVSIALLALAFGAGMAFLYLNRKIKSKEKLSGFGKDLPSLNAFDRINAVAVKWGFPLYTIGLLSGFVWARLTWGKLVTWDPKEIVSIFIWLAYAFLFHQRLALGWQGRKPARLAIWIFLFTIASMTIINFFLPTHHGFNPTAN